jgi:hypothetical protein
MLIRAFWRSCYPPGLLEEPIVGMGFAPIRLRERDQARELRSRGTGWGQAPSLLLKLWGDTSVQMSVSKQSSFELTSTSLLPHRLKSPSLNLLV